MSSSSRGTSGDDYNRGQARVRRGLSRPVKALLLSLAVLAGLLDHALGGWMGPAAMAALAVVVPVLLLQRFWAETWFWVTATLLAVAQIPLVVFVRPLMERARSPYMLGFAVIDGLLIIAVISLVCSRSNGGITARE